jgi:predicted Rossmann-fold nucleotide-binding protein
MRVSVIGGGRVTEAEYEQAREVGRLLAERGHAVVCGGRTGVMEAACRGAREAAEAQNASSPASQARQDAGETIGILPGENRTAANEFVTTPIATGMGNARNVLVVLNGDAVVAVDGSTGTLSEIAHALDMGRPVAGIGTRDVEGVQAVETAADAVEYVEQSV